MLPTSTACAETWMVGCDALKSLTIFRIGTAWDPLWVYQNFSAIGPLLVVPLPPLPLHALTSKAISANRPMAQGCTCFISGLQQTGHFAFHYTQRGAGVSKILQHQRGRCEGFTHRRCGAA